MFNMLYAKLAAVNLRNNKIFYLPYLLAGIGVSAMTYIMFTLTNDPALLTMRGRVVTKTSLIFGCVITVIFSVIILLYTGSVLTKRRKKEFGLYSILGMEKRHIGRVLRWETLYTAAIALVCGIGAGILTSKLLQLLLMRFIGCDVQFGIRIDVAAIIITTVIFAAIYEFLYLKSLIVVRMADPAQLLRASSEGEREPKSNVLITIIGLLCLLGGYAMSILTNSMVYAITLFFIAVLLVIAGTYLLFTSFSIVLLKRLRKNKSYYYKTNHFATVSGMIYRMKRNAAGLASICILSTMVLLAVSTTVCLYVSTDETLNAQYPYDMMLNYYHILDADEAEYIENMIDTVTEEFGIEAVGTQNFLSLRIPVLRNENVIISGDSYAKTPGDGYNEHIVWITTAEGYKSLTGGEENIELAPGEVMAYYEGELGFDSLTLLGESFDIVHKPDSFPEVSAKANISSLPVLYLVVDGVDTITHIMELRNSDTVEIEYDIYDNYYFNLTGNDSVKYDFGDKFIELARKDAEGLVIGNCVCKLIMRQEQYSSFYGAFLFLGLFLGLLFVLATVLIIYYKQLSEDYDDRSRFDIMEKVGMTRAEVKSTIRAQVQTVFFLPLIVAASHVLFAFPMVRSILGAFGMTNLPLFIICTVITYVIFALLYFFVYSATARTYYKIVSSVDVHV